MFRPMPTPYDPASHIRTIYLDQECQDSPLAKSICDRASVPVKLLPPRTHPPEQRQSPHGLTLGKQNLLLCNNRGSFFKPCPGTKEYCCCDYQVLNIGMGCPMDCVYCILQAYLNNDWMSFFVNTDDLLSELDLAFQRTTQFWRIGTGEFSDSLAIDHLTGLSPILINYMRDKNGMLELKTKSANIKNLLDLDHNGRIMVSWSLNATRIMAREEIRTASLDERLHAAKTCGEHGYKLGFHFDPIIYHEGWQEGYTATIKALFATVPAEKISWISLGALRFLPALKPFALTRFPASTFFHEEFIIGLDNKYRYFRSLRVEMYSFIVNLLRQYVADHTCLYFCMESDEIWQECGFKPGESSQLPDNLDLAFQQTPL
ncbi:MAG: DNA photolyase [Desulfobulbaceae bacterium]|jgi:spore photoproduct lyase|nr:DNA photolyase [Desulfobulbaceae bacterium]